MMLFTSATEAHMSVAARPVNKFYNLCRADNGDSKEENERQDTERTSPPFQSASRHQLTIHLRYTETDNMTDSMAGGIYQKPTSLVSFVMFPANSTSRVSIASSRI